MQASTAKSARLHQEYDRIPILGGAPSSAFERGTRAASAGSLTYSTGQPRGWIVAEVKPGRKVRSYTTASR